MLGRFAVISCYVVTSCFCHDDRNWGAMLLKADDSTVKQVFDYIERHSKYVFVYDQKVKNLLSKKVNIQTKGKSVEQVLSDVCSQIGFKYQVKNRQVTISLGEKKSVQPSFQSGKKTGKKLRVRLATIRMNH